MLRNSSRRPSRAFRPSSLGISHLEPRVVLSAESIAAALTEVADTKAQLEADIAQYKLDYIIHQNNGISWQQSVTDFNVRVLALRVDMIDFFNEYKPKKITLKSESKVVNGKTEWSFSVEADLTGIIQDLLANAQSKKQGFETRAAAFTTERNQLEQQLADLRTDSADLAKRKADLDKRKQDLEMMEQGIDQEEIDENMAPTIFDDSDIEDYPDFDGSDLAAAEVLPGWEDLVLENDPAEG